MPYFLCLLLVGLVYVKSDTSEITILSPLALKESYNSTNGKISAKPALFGTPVYNEYFGGEIKAYKEQMDACEKLPAYFFQSDPLDESSKNIALVERGSCQFIEKVKNCQRAGAKAVVVYDNNRYGDLPIMACDGTGDFVSIPSIIIRNEDGLILKSHVEDDSVQAVEIEISWGLPSSDGRVEWEFWTSSDMLLRDDDVVSDLKGVVQSLGDNQLFTPHYVIYEGIRRASGRDCSNDRKYCTRGVNGVSGKQVLKEWLTQKCVWKYGQDVNDMLLWWEYVEMFNLNCAGDRYKWNGFCSTSVLEELTEAEIRANLVDDIERCVVDSGDLDGESNTIFDAEVEAFTKYDILLTPAVTINNEEYHGNLDCPDTENVATCSVFGAICAAFAPETTPPSCLELENACPSGGVRDICGVCGGDGSSCTVIQVQYVSFWFIVIIILIVVFACGAGLYFKRRFTATEVKEQKETLEVIETSTI